MYHRSSPNVFEGNFSWRAEIRALASSALRSLVVPIMVLLWDLGKEKADGAEGRRERNELKCVEVLIPLEEEFLQA